MLKLVIGNYNISSWSLRPWLALKQSGLPFEAIPLPLRTSATRSEILKYSPSGKVPCLIDGGLAVWDSLAICEYLAEKVPALWPSDASARAEARAISAEMHSGFAALREVLTLDVRSILPTPALTPEVERDIDRITTMWESCRQRFADAGPFLFGAFSIADAMYAPVAFRFLNYQVALPAASQAWVDTMVALPAMQEWRRAALAEAH